LTLGLVLWVVRQGKYLFVGVTEESFKAALLYALRQLGLSYRESLAGMRLEALGVDLKVTLQGSFGGASMEIQPRAAYPHLSRIVGEMRNYFTTNPVSSKPLPYVIYTAGGGSGRCRAVLGILDLSFERPHTRNGLAGCTRFPPRDLRGRAWRFLTGSARRSS
jgi:hypothetical protein